MTLKFCLLVQIFIQFYSLIYDYHSVTRVHSFLRLRKKWSDALMNRREYLDTEVRKIMEKREPNVADLEKQNELLDQWAMLQWQRAAVLQPKAASGVPGAPTSWRQLPGFEARVPVVFLDLNDDLLTPCDDDPVEAVKAGAVFGEKEETMIRLPIIKREEHIVSYIPCMYYIYNNMYKTVL